MSDDFENGSIEHIRALAAALSENEEIILGPSDQDLCKRALALLAAEAK